MRTYWRYGSMGLLVLVVLLGGLFGLVSGSSPTPEFCQEFRWLTGGARMISTFSWTPVSPADEYKINLYGSDGRIVKSIWVKAATTSIDLNLGDYGTGPTFQWEVEALQNGKSICNTGRTDMLLKAGDSNPAPRAPVPMSTEAVVP